MPSLRGNHYMPGAQVYVRKTDNRGIYSNGPLVAGTQSKWRLDDVQETSPAAEPETFRLAP